MEQRQKIISSIYPLAKLLTAMLFIILSAVYDWRMAYLVIFPGCLILSAIDGRFKSYAKKIIITLFLLLLMIFLLKILLDNSDSRIYVDLGYLTIREQGILDGLLQTKVLVAMGSTLMLFFETTDMEDFMISLQKLHVSHVASYIILSTMQMIPEMINKSEVIMQAQQARGIETKGNPIIRAKAFFPSLGPLIISSVTDIEERSITLEVRGFSSTNKKTTLKLLTVKRSDIAIMLTSSVVFVFLIVWRFAA